MSVGLGPVLGGWLVQHLSWRWAFFINIPLAAAVLPIVFFCLVESRDDEVRPGLDLAGAILATAGLGGIVYGLIESSNLGLTNPRIVITLSVGAFGLAAFVANEARGRNPMVPLALFRSKTFAGANLLTLLLYAALSGVLFYYPFDLIQVQGYTAGRTGAAFLPFVLTMFLLSRWSGALVDRYGARVPLIAGPLIAGVGFALFALPGIGGSYWTTFFPAVMATGIGMAVSAAPLTTVVMGSVPERHAGVASGINNAISRTAGLIAIAGLNIFMLHAFKISLENSLDRIGASSAVKESIEGQASRLAGIAVPSDMDSAGRAAVEWAIGSSFVTGFRVVIWICVALALAGSLSAWLLIEADPERKPARARAPVKEAA
jgi:MFS family permease